jgi:hypothetical protein
VQCLICSQSISNKHFPQHLRKNHHITQEQYTLQFIYNNDAATCKCGCGQKTSYRKGTYSFNEYIHNHHKPTLGKEMSQETRDKLSLKQRQFQGTLTTEQRLARTLPAITAAQKATEQKYGVRSLFMLPEFQKENSKRSKLKAEQMKEKLRLSEEGIKQKCNLRGYEALFQYEEYLNAKQTLPFRCIKHDVQFELQLRALNRLGHEWCYKCRDYGSSKEEAQLTDYIRSIYNENIVEKKRNIIKPYELDVFIPQKHIAFEYNGLHWHCEKYREKDYHFLKFQRCLQENIQLIQLFSDEWLNKQDVCKSLIKAKLGLLPNIHARKLTVNENPDKELVSEFLDKTHLAGNTKFIKAFTLENQGTIKMALTLRKPFTKRKEAVLEIARMASDLNIVVSGGFDKLMYYAKKWAAENSHTELLTYSDCRYSIGNVYKRYGFCFAGHTGVGYSYTDNHNRFNRLKFRARGGLSETQIAQVNSVRKIYDAGHYRWSLKLN